MNYRHVSSVLFFWLFVEACAKRPSFKGDRADDVISCNPTCSKRGNIRTFYNPPCSCSESCLRYGDCCQDAQYQNTGKEKIDFGCLMLDGLGPVSVVSNCPSFLEMEREPCVEGPKTSIPVTSLQTGISYSSYDCALCNNDSYSLIVWPVELRCCPDEEGQTDDATVVKKRMQNQNINDNLESIPKDGEVSDESCDCRFYARNDLTFAMSLELRKCAPVMISTCSSNWLNDNTRILCSSYLDPVRNGEKVYRNSYCATCNFEDIQMLKCYTLRSSSATMEPHGMEFPPEKCKKGQKYHPVIKKCLNYYE